MADSMKIECEQRYAAELRCVQRPKHRGPIWRVAVFEAEQLLFEDPWVGLKLTTFESATWLVQTLLSALRRQAYVFPQGHEPHTQLLMLASANRSEPIEWDTRSSDDMSAIWNGCTLRVEHLEGPLRGGRWWVCVRGARGEARWESSEQPGLLVQSASSAMWLCECVARTLPGDAPFEVETS